MSAGELAMTFDITTPWARDFFEPQKVAVIVSSLENFSREDINLIIEYTANKRKESPNIKDINVPSEISANISI